MMMAIEFDLNKVFNELVGELAFAFGPAVERLPHWRPILAQLQSQDWLLRQPQAQAGPVQSSFAESITTLRSGPSARLSTLLEQLEQLAHWQQNPNYTAANTPPGFLDRYGYFEIVGEKGFVQLGQLALGVLQLGPNTQYLRHQHPAEECYLLLAGESLWTAGDVTTSHQPNKLIYHAPHVPHGMESLDQPMMAVYLWAGDLKTPALFSAL